MWRTPLVAATGIPAGCLLTLLLVGTLTVSHAQEPSELVFRGISDASAAMAVDSNRFLLANDEDNTIRLYSVADPGLPLQIFPWNKHLALGDPEHVECDVEGATLVGKRIYWIGSHGRNRNGRWRSNRHRLFATDVSVNGSKVQLRPLGFPCTNLVSALLAEPALAHLGLREAVGEVSAVQARLAPKKRGLNIEGLAEIPGSDGLLIGFRNPCPQGKALLIPLRNPSEIILSSASPVFGAPILLNLQGLGIRDIAYSRQLAAYIIVAGSRDGTDETFAVFTWTGKAGAAPQAFIRARDLAGSKPEAIVVFPFSPRVLLISDDGSLVIESPVSDREGLRMKDLVLPLDKSFRARWLRLP